MLTWMDWSGVIVGVLVLIHVAQGRVGRSRPPGAFGSRVFFVAISSLPAWASLLALAAYLLTLPSTPPFQPGQLLGKGTLLGAVLMLGSVLLLLRWGQPGAPGDDGAPDRLRLAPAACALLAVNVVFLIWRKTPVEPMLGLCLSAALFGAILRYGLGTLAGGLGDDGDLQAPGRQAERLALLTVANAAAVGLAAEHFAASPGLWCLPIALGAVTLVAAVAADALGNLVAQGIGRPVAYGAAVVIAAGAAALVAGGAFGQSLGVYSYVTGLVAMGLATWLVLSTGGSASRSLRTGVIAGLLAVGACVVSFRLMAGLGAALALQAGWLLWVLPLRDEAERDSASDRLLPLLGVGLLFVLYRLNQQLVPMGRSGDLLAHYSLIALALGVLVPFLWQAYLLQGRARVGGLLQSADVDSEGGAVAVKAVIGRLAGLGIVVAGAPALLYFLWPRYAVAGYLMGLFVAQLVLVLRQMELAAYPPSDHLRHLPACCPGLLCVASMLAAIPACRFLADAGDVPRLYKAIAAAAVVLVLYGWGYAASRGSDAPEEASAP